MANNQEEPAKKLEVQKQEPKQQQITQQRINLMNSLPVPTVANLDSLDSLQLCILLRSKGLDDAWVKHLDFANCGGKYLLSMVNRTDGVDKWTFFTKSGFVDWSELHKIEELIKEYNLVYFFYAYSQYFYAYSQYKYIYTCLDKRKRNKYT